MRQKKRRHDRLRFRRKGFSHCGASAPFLRQPVASRQPSDSIYCYGELLAVSLEPASSAGGTLTPAGGMSSSGAESSEEGGIYVHARAE